MTDSDVRTDAQQFFAEYDIRGPMTMADVDRIIADVGLVIPPAILSGRRGADLLLVKLHFLGHCLLGDATCRHFPRRPGTPIVRLRDMVSA